ncbi:hypothetical protein ACFQS7_13260 [Dankookia sp. GCM10030260]|uniref:hypothetical protein n=1 Tax=Dankookia sp. GCM10030260 TaxID=3273390 RepID=UPI00360D4314
MAEGTKRQDHGNGAAETMRRGTQATAEIAGRAGKAAVEAVQRGDAALEAAARQAGSAMRQGAEVTAAAPEMVQRPAAEIARRAEAMEAGSRQLAQGTAEAAAQGVSQGAEAMRRAMSVPMSGMGELPQAFAGMFNDMVRANMQIGQEMMRLANPAALFALQQKMLRDYLDMVMGGAKAAETGRQDR